MFIPDTGTGPLFAVSEGAASRAPKRHAETGRVPFRRPQSVLPTPKGGNMDNTTLLIILIVVIIVLGGGWYGRGRWY